MDPRVVRSKGMSVIVLWAFVAVSAVLTVVLLVSGSVSSVLWLALGLAAARLSLRQCVMDGSTWHVRGFWQTYHVPIEELTSVSVDDPMIAFTSHTVVVGFRELKIGVASFANDEVAEQSVAAMRACLPSDHPLRHAPPPEARGAGA